MLNYNLDSMDSATKLIHMCDKYKGKMEIDVICGRQIIDAYSALGIYSLVGKIVSIEPLTNNREILMRFKNDLEKLK